MIVFLDEMNARVGFWWMWWHPLAAGGWPRAYLWKCGCCGVSHDGRLLGLAACEHHLVELEADVALPLRNQNAFSAREIISFCQNAFRSMRQGEPVSDRVSMENAIACIEAAKGARRG